VLLLSELLPPPPPLLLLLLCSQNGGVQVDAPYTSVTVPGRKLKDVSVDAPYTSADVSVGSQLVLGYATVLASPVSALDMCVCQIH
jgi:hypothetical protein